VARVLNLDRERRLQALLWEALALPTERRRDHVVTAAGDDRRLAAEVLELLADEEGLAGFLETPAAVDLRPDDLETAEPEPGDGSADVLPPPDYPARIGPFTIVDRLGAGGMGEVFRARQEEPVRREVALKRVHTYLPPEALDRFLVEQQALARLSHTNVARLYDAGTTADGRPYFAMELIRGRPVTVYCDEERLGVEERLRIFLGICAGVEHAHQKQVLHRDLKPSNVLVADESGRPVPKVIDFGIAKSLGEPGSGLTLDTRLGGLVGTPTYMSPEALSSGRAEGGLDTRSDVYSLGVLLFELLTGRTPFEEDGAGLVGLISRIGDGRAEIPSQRLRRLSEDESGEVAARRGVLRADLVRRVRDDLDWIVARAMAPERERRYGSVGELAADVERHLRDEPVEARPPSTLYVLRKALHRHRTAAIAAAFVLVALVLGIAGTSLALLRARRAESRAVAEAAAARESRAESDQVVDFLTGVLAASGPDAKDTTRPPSQVTALELLDRGAARVDRELADQPRIQTRVETTIGRVYRQLGLYDESLKHLDKALAATTTETAPDAHSLARTHLSIAEVYLNQARTKEAGEALDQALAASGTGREREDRELRAIILEDLGRQRRLAGDFAASEQYLQHALDLHVELDGADSADVGITLTNLGATLFVQQRWAEAETRFRQALEILQKTLPPGHSRLATVTDDLAASVASQGRLEEAAPIFEAALAEKRRLLGDSHPAVADSLNNLGSLYLDLGQPGKAADYHRQALAIRERVLGPKHPKTAWSLDNLAHALDALGRTDEAVRLQRRALAIREGHYGHEHVELTRSLDHLADLAVEQGDYRGALALGERSLRIVRSQPKPGPAQVGDGAVRLGTILWHLGDQAAARERFTEGLTALEAGGDATAEDLAKARKAVAKLGAQ
jgi:eukaryotic-like serine/threonine-protein kinase